MVAPMRRFLLLICCLAAPLSAKPATDRPNVVIIFLDDSGYGDYSHHGNPTIETPAISRLAAEGAEFTQFYVASPACSASRYSLLTGRYPSRSGFPTWVIGPQLKAFLDPRQETIAQGLKARGYATALFGKWHLGNPNPANAMTPDALPLAHGFDEWIGTNVSHDYVDAKLLASDPAGDTPVKGYREIARDLPSHPDVCDGLTRRYTDAAVDFIRRKKGAPFFLYLAHNQPHLGLHVSDGFRGKSRRGLLGDVMAEIDDSVSRVMRALDECGVAGNTLVVFSSDNGPWIKFQDAAPGAKYGDARLHVGYAQPFRDGKGSNWEGGHRVAGIFHWPGVIRPARVLEPAATLDVLPTVFAFCGVEIPREAAGRDLRSVLAGKPPAVPFSFGYSGPDNRLSGWREGPWKLLVRTPSQIRDPSAPQATAQRPLLFNVEQDLGERIDRATENPAIVARLMEKLTADSPP